MRTLVLAAVALSSVLLPTATAQSIWIVDENGGPGSNFVTLTDAVAGAADGDTLLVREGEYPETVVIDDRDLSIVADTTALVVVHGFVVRDLAAGRGVLINGIETRPRTIESGYSLLIQDCDGPVLIEECVLGSGEQTLPTSGSGGKFVVRSSQVTFARCELEPEAFLPVATLVVQASRVALFEIEAIGRTGSPPPLFGVTESGTPAVELIGSTATISGCQLTGGDGGGGVGVHGACGNGGDGAPALRLDGAVPSTATTIDCLLVGGVGGAPDLVNCPTHLPGADGPPVEVLNGTHTPTGTLAPRYRLVTPLRAGELLNFELTGVPFSQTWLLIGFGPGAISGHPILTGVVTVGAPQLMVPFFSVPADGELTYVDLPGTILLPPGFSHLELHFQHLMFEPVQGLVIGTPASILVLDPSL